MSAYLNRFVRLIVVDYKPDNAPEGAARVAKRTASTPAAFAAVDEGDDAGPE